MPVHKSTICSLPECSAPLWSPELNPRCVRITRVSEKGNKGS